MQEKGETGFLTVLAHGISPNNQRAGKETLGGHLRRVHDAAQNTRAHE
jgi:hypothetical protein